MNIFKLVDILVEAQAKGCTEVVFTDGRTIWDFDSISRVANTTDTVCLFSKDHVLRPTVTVRSKEHVKPT